MNKEVKRYTLFASLRSEAIAFLPDEVVSARDYDALLAERDALREALESFPGFLCGTATADAWIERKRTVMQKS